MSFLKIISCIATFPQSITEINLTIFTIQNASNINIRTDASINNSNVIKRYKGYKKHHLQEDEMAIQFWIQGRKIIQIVIPEEQNTRTDQVSEAKYACHNELLKKWHGFSFCDQQGRNVELLDMRMPFKRCTPSWHKDLCPIRSIYQIFQFYTLPQPTLSTPYSIFSKNIVQHVSIVY